LIAISVASSSVKGYVDEILSCLLINVSFTLHRIPCGLLRGFCVLAKSVPEGAKFRNTPSACDGDRNFEDFASLLQIHFPPFRGVVCNSGEGRFGRAFARRSNELFVGGHGTTKALLQVRCYCCVISRFSSASSSLITSPDTSITTCLISPLKRNGAW
jgi:hypothetical protein